MENLLLIKGANQKHALLMMGEILKEINPVAYYACANLHRAPLRDWGLIPEVFAQISNKYISTIDNHPIFLAVLYKLYVPWKLHKVTPKLTVGLRDHLNNVLKYENPNMINYFSENIIVLYKSKNWANTIDSLATDILNDLQTRFNENLSKPIVQSIDL